ncbi:MAG: hypothetical protein M1838_005727 [Thelocarpon superellum]|nr:MAG: hypothetical protein M1838_005727 [Thelocarpon superellum]
MIESGNPSNGGPSRAARPAQPEHHPLAPLTASEIIASALLIRQTYPPEVALRFKSITLLEPAKEQILPYVEATLRSESPLPIARRAFVAYYLLNTDKFHEAHINLSSGTIESTVRLGPNQHGACDGAEILDMERIALQDDGVQAEIAKLKLPAGTVVISDPWIYGSDGVQDDRRRYQCFLYMRDPMHPSEPDSNHYALPLAISPVIDTETRKVIRIDKLPTGRDATVKETQPYQLRPANEYLPERQQLRTDLKPLHVVQPEGASFRVHHEGETGRFVEWQKWSFQLGFNAREGMVLYNVRYDGRSLFYRVALSDMNIPYADPRNPFHRKSAFDLGDAGAGVMANDLRLGCDCLGSIYYFDGLVVDEKGEPLKLNNAVCLHEQDAGIGFKHTNYRTGRAVLVRNRELVLQSIITVANYEYILAFVFNQAAEFAYEVRATGVLSTQPVDDGVDVPWGTVVHPGVLASHHQHLFSLRVDPALDGPLNRVVYDEAHAMARDPVLNPHGVGYVVQETVLEASGGFDADATRGGVFKIQNVAVRNAVNHKPVAYRIQAPAFQRILADPESFHHRRAEFADHSVYVTAYREGELYAGGRYTNQSRGGMGVRSWADRKDNVKDADVVLWVQFGINHIPRIEDFPVMSSETMRVSFKPVNFFDKNPALDVPPAEQVFNRSILLSERHHQGTLEAAVGERGEVHYASQT